MKSDARGLKSGRLPERGDERLYSLFAPSRHPTTIMGLIVRSSMIHAAGVAGSKGATVRVVFRRRSEDESEAPALAQEVRRRRVEGLNHRVDARVHLSCDERQARAGVFAPCLIR